MESAAQKVPVERLEVAEVENQAMALGDGTLIKSFGSEEGKKGIGLLARFLHAVQKGLERDRCCSRRRHGLPGGEPDCSTRLKRSETSLPQARASTPD